MQNLERRRGYRNNLFEDYIKQEWIKFNEQDSIFDLIVLVVLVAFVGVAWF